MQFHQVLKDFHSLTPDELYSILQLRTEVFVVEQNCVFQDLDNKDQGSYHLMFYSDNKLEAYARLLPAGVTYPEISIGRVVTSSRVRGSGVGRKLMNESIHLCYELFGKAPIKIGAQLYAKKFYEQLGFSQCGPIYLEDGIEHILMIKD
jgi:ElaA protein